MRVLRTASLMIIGAALIMVAAGCARTTKDITVERHVVGEEYVVE